MNRVSKNLNVAKENIHLWTDSAIVLTWLNSHPSRWQTYVAHRVQDIQNLYEASHWNHVRTHENPADIASRGVFPSVLKNNSLWFNSPQWLLEPNSQWPKIDLKLASNINIEEKSHVNLISMPVQESELLLRFSDYHHLLRITAFILRFVNRTRRTETFKYPIQYITVLEMNRAKLLWIKQVQSLHLLKEIESIQDKKFCIEKSNLKNLNPQLNAQGILIVNGRLRFSNLPTISKFPAILPAKSHFTKLIIENAHESTLHGTIHLTLARTRQEFGS